MAGLGGMVGAIGGKGVAKLAGYVLQATGSYVTLFAMVPGASFLALLVRHLLLPRSGPADPTADA